MMDNDPEELRSQVRCLVNSVCTTDDRDEKRKLASQAFALAQRAEQIERIHATTNGAAAGCDPNFRSIADSNIQRFIECLYSERDENRRQLFRNLLLWETRWYGSRQERLDAIQRLLRDCDGRVLRYRALFDEQQATGVAAGDAQLLLDNLLDVQCFLRESLRTELTR